MSKNSKIFKILFSKTMHIEIQTDKIANVNYIFHTIEMSADQSVFGKGFLQDVRHNLREYFFKHSLKHPLHQQHIQNRSTANTKQCILFHLCKIR